MYEKIFLVLILCSKLLIVISWKTTANYCEKKCPSRPDKHTACDCKIIEPRKIIDERLQEFRQKIVNVHNQYRNQIASGGEKDKGYPEAANMMAVSYNLELEYIAKCYAGIFVKGHDRCRDMAKSKASAGQNLGGSSNFLNLKNNYTGMAWRWYNELNNIKSGQQEDFIKKYNKKHAEENKMVGHFSQFVWWSVSLVGCARVQNNESKENGWQNSLICNYGGGSVFVDTPNLDDKPIYKIGPKCSSCPKGTACNSDYPALCGPIAATPADQVLLGKPTSQTVRIYQSKLLLVIVLLVLLNLN